MKALSLWQPWASLLCIGSKTVETRSWPTNYRGDLLIHAGKKRIPELLRLLCCWNFDAALHPLGGTMTPGCSKDIFSIFPFGAIIGKVKLVDCRRTESFTVGELDVPQYPPGVTFKSWTERDLGNFDPGRFGWVMTHFELFPNPVPYTGRQGLFEVPDSDWMY